MYISRQHFEWIKELADNANSGWSMKDVLHIVQTNEILHLSVFHSSHIRENGLSDIELRHLWIEIGMESDPARAGISNRECQHCQLTLTIPISQKALTNIINQEIQPNLLQPDCLAH